MHKWCSYASSVIAKTQETVSHKINPDHHPQRLIENMLSLHAFCV